MEHNISSNAASITTIAPVRPEWMSVLTMEQIKEWTEGYEMVHLIVPEGITGIHGAVDPDDCREHWLWDEWVEYGCSKIAAVTIPDSVTSIGLAAFSGCVNLTSINIPDGVMEIGAWAFYGCKSLTSINIPDSVAKIGKYAFEGCSGLAHINIPDSITTIDESVFMRCSNLEFRRIPSAAIGRIILGKEVPEKVRNLKKALSDVVNLLNEFKKTNKEEVAETAKRIRDDLSARLNEVLKDT